MTDEQPDEQVQVWFQDEARIGRQGTLTNVWARTGSCPTAVKQTEYEWCCRFAAVNPATGASSAMVTPTVNTASMNPPLRFVSREAESAGHDVLVPDQAGWHVAEAPEDYLWPVKGNQPELLAAVSDAFDDADTSPSPAAVGQGRAPDGTHGRQGARAV